MGLEMGCGLNLASRTTELLMDALASVPTLEVLMRGCGAGAIL